MEVWIKKARLNPICAGQTVDGGVESDLSTFMYVDFFDFETQSTQLHPGSNIDDESFSIPRSSTPYFLDSITNIIAFTHLHSAD